MKQRHLIKVMILIMCTALSMNSVLASACVNAFPDGVQSHSTDNKDKILFECDARIINNPDTIIGGYKVEPEEQCLPTCGTSDCTNSAVVNQIDPGNFQRSSKSDGDVTVTSGQSQTIGTAGETDYDVISVGSGATLTFSDQGAATQYKINKLQLDDGAKIQLVSGEFWIDTLDADEQDITIEVIGTTTAKVFFNKNTTIEKDAMWNIDETQNDIGKKLFIYGYSNITIKDGASMNAVIYTERTLKIEDNISLSGAYTAKDIDLGIQAKISFVSSYVSGMDFSNICATNAICQSTFPGGAQTFSGSIDLMCDAQVLDNPSTALPASSISFDEQTDCENTCGTSNCTVSGTPSAKVDAGAFLSSSKSEGSVTVSQNNTAQFGASNEVDYDRITANNNSTITFLEHTSDTTYKIQTLSIGDNVTVNLYPGDYWINSMSVGDDVNFVIQGAGTARLFINSNVDFGKRVKMNQGQSSSKLFLYGYKRLRWDDELQAAFVLYSQGKVEVDKNSTLFGAISAEEVTLKSSSTITYDSAAVAAVDFGFICPTSSVTNFVLTHGNSGVLCIEHPVTVTAKNGTDTVTDYTGTVVLDTGSGKGTWSLSSGNGVFSDPVSNDGLATYTYAEADQGVATFVLDYFEGTRTIDIEVYDNSDNSIRDDDSDGTVTFADLGFLLTASPLGATPTSLPASYSDTQTAGISDTIYLTAYGLDSNSQVCGVVSSYTGSKSLKAWSTYVNPTSGTLTPLINSDSVGNSEGNATTHVLNFTSGTTSFTTLYRDAGQIRLSLKDDSFSPIYSGATANYVVKPARLEISVTNNPGATTASGAKFIAAGDNFTATVTAKDNDGNTTPNFGNETSAESVKIISSTLVLPADGRNGSNNDGAIGNGSNFTKVQSGVFEATNLSFDEVGIIKLTASISDGDYLGAGDVSGPESSEVGKFVPFDFDVSANTPVVDAGCIVGGFTYLDQPFLYNVKPQVTVTARAVGGTTTENYKGDFWRITTNLLNPTYSSNSPTASLNVTDALTDITFSDLANGTGTYTFGDGGGMRFERSTGQLITNFDAELELAITVIDEDDVAYASNPYRFGGTATTEGISFSGGKRFYQGRIHLGQISGSELLPLSVPFEVQYFDGSGFTTNTVDSCTPFSNPAHVLLSSDPAELSTTPQVTTFINGFGLIVLTAPTPSGTTGQVNVEVDLSSSAANLPYLQFDWPYDGAADGLYDDNPRSRATFGIDRGADEIIYLREIY